MGKIYRPTIPIKKGRIENTMDKALIIILIVILFAIICSLTFSYTSFSKSVDELASGEYIVEDDENKMPSNIQITEDGRLLIKGQEVFKDKPLDEYSVNDFMSIGISIFNENVFSIGERNEAVFKLKDVALWGTVILFVYWVALLFIYEKESNIKTITQITDEEIFKKYNPLIMGCIEGNRNVMHRDIIAVLFGLINKKIIELKIVPDNENTSKYKYLLIRNKTNEANIPMDEIEKYVHCIAFGDPGYAADEIELISFVEQFSEREDRGKLMKQLQKLAKAELNKLGANKNKVPLITRIFNIGIFLTSLALFLSVIWQSIFHLEITTVDIVLLHFAVMFIGFFIPILILLVYSAIIFFIQTSKIMKRIADKFADKRVVAVTTLVVAILSLLIYLTFKFSITTAIIPYELLICMAFLIIKTDNLLLKNDVEIMADYNRMKMLKERVKEYSTLDKREIENIKLWDFYMTSAVAFGIARKAIVQSDVDMKFERVDKGYLVDLVIDVLEAFIEVNLQ